MYTFDPNLVLYIPYISKKWANVKKIKSIFENLQIGIVKKIDLIVSKNSNKNIIIYEGFIHFFKWHDSVQNRNIQEKIFNNVNAKLVYDDPKYWILNKSTSNHSYNEKKIGKNLGKNLGTKNINNYYFIIVK